MDDFHPNETGERKMARKWCEALVPVLRQMSTVGVLPGLDGKAMGRANGGRGSGLYDINGRRLRPGQSSRLCRLVCTDGCLRPAAF